jgi:hypothetical protein
MTGMLNLPATVPTVGTHAANKTYVDTGLNGKSTIYSATSPPAGVADNSMWFESDTGLLYVKYNDGSTSQWVIACPQPDISNFVLRSGDNMSGPLGIPLTPTLPAHATSKSYVDAQLAGKSSIIASDTPPVGAIDNSLWYETDSGATYVRYNDLNGGAQWVAIADPAGLVYAAPFDALAYSGLQINGSMEVSQENGGTNIGVTPGTTKYVVDGFAIQMIGVTRQINAQQAASPIAGFSKHLQLGVAVAGVPGVNDAQNVYQAIEGYRWARLGWGTASAQPVTISFWIYVNITGIVTVSIRNGTGTRSYVVEVPVTAGAYAYKTVTIPGDTTGTWATDNTTAAYVGFCFGAGSGYQTAPNAWAAGNFFVTAGTMNLCAAVNNAALLTGVVVLPGIEAPRADRSALIMRPFDQELTVCKRYWQKLGGASGTEIFINGYCAAGQGLTHPFILPVEMRTNPTATIVGTWTLGNVSALVINGQGPKNINLQAGAVATGQTYAYTTNATCFITLDARL